MLPQVAIVGRPNVGKSSLLNLLAGRRVSIVEPTAGVTRDRVTAEVNLSGAESGGAEVPCELVDTGGYGIYGPGSELSPLTADVEKQIDNAMETASVVLFVVDAASGIMPLDRQVAGLLRKRGGGLADRVLVVANKVDSDKRVSDAQEASELGFGEPICVSATTKRGKRALLEKRGPTPRLGQQAKIYYVTQIGTSPPAIAMVVNNPDLFDQRYQRYILNRLRENTPFEEVPIKLVIRPRRRSDVYEDELTE